MDYENIETREQLIDRVWDEICDLEERKLDIHVRFQNKMEELHQYAIQAGILSEGESFSSIMEAARNPKGAAE